MGKINPDYWNPYSLLPYQRNFNFVNSVRSIGKTYGMQLFILDRFFEREEQSVYLCRTKVEKRNGFLKKAFEKVMNQEERFREKAPDFKWSNEKLTYKGKVVCHCIAISEAIKMKNQSFPFVKWGFMDEYMLEREHERDYVHGWGEPDLVLNLYQTIDRDEDRLVMFFMGNNTNFYNPYHMHKAFRIPKIEQGCIWTSENVLFQFYVPTKQLKESKEKTRFSRMIRDTDYGHYAIDGTYQDDNDSFIAPMTANTHLMCNYLYNGKEYGFYVDTRNGKAFITQKLEDASLLFALTTEDHKENTVLTRCIRGTMRYDIGYIKQLSRLYKFSNLYFTDRVTKAEFMPALQMIA